MEHNPEGSWRFQCTKRDFGTRPRGTARRRFQGTKCEAEASAILERAPEGGLARAFRKLSARRKEARLWNISPRGAGHDGVLELLRGALSILGPNYGNIPEAEKDGVAGVLNYWPYPRVALIFWAHVVSTKFGRLCP